MEYITNPNLLKLLQEIESEKDSDLCSICYNKNTDNDSITLKCSHRFHTECIKNLYQQILCPYCKQIFNNHDLISPCCAIIKSGKNKGKPCCKKAYNDSKLCRVHMKIKNNNFCKAIIASGKNKGNECRSKCQGEYCKRHQNVCFLCS